MDITINPMETENEIKGKAYVHWKSWQEAYAGLIDSAYLESMSVEKCMARAYQKENTLVAKDGERVIGFAAYCPGQDEDMPGAGELQALYILSEYYGTGVGQALMRAALEGLSEYNRIILWVLKGNGRAIRFYEKCGFRLDGAEQVLKIGREVTALRMTLVK